MHLSRNWPFSNKTNLHLKLPGLSALTPLFRFESRTHLLKPSLTFDNAFHMAPFATKPGNSPATVKLKETRLVLKMLLSLSLSISVLSRLSLSLSPPPPPPTPPKKKHRIQIGNPFGAFWGWFEFMIYLNFEKENVFLQNGSLIAKGCISNANFPSESPPVRSHRLKSRTAHPELQKQLSRNCSVRLVVEGGVG